MPTEIRLTSSDELRIGIIGTGNMGSMLARAFAEVSRAEVFVYNRTPDKAEMLAAEHSNMHVLCSAAEVACQSSFIFVCTKLDSATTIMKEIGRLCAPSQVIATTCSSAPLRNWESLTMARLAKVIPSITQTCRSGVILVSYGQRFGTAEQETFENVLGQVGTPFPVEDRQIRVCSDLTSCGPAFLSYVLKTWAKAAADTRQISHGEAEFLLSKMLIGVGQLLEGGMTLSDIVQKVSVPGGVTEVGLNILKGPVPEMMRHLHDATASHHKPQRTLAP